MSSRGAPEKREPESPPGEQATCSGGQCCSGPRTNGATAIEDGTLDGRAVSFRVFGLDCAEEAAALRVAVGQVVGGADLLAFDVLNGRMTVQAPVDPGAVLAAVATTGMRAEVWHASRGASAAQDGRRRLLAVLAGASGALVAAGFALESRADARVAAHAAEAAAAVLGLWLVAPKALFAIRRRRPDMNLLMTVAVAGAMGLGDWLEAGTVAFLFAVSLALESWSTARARRAIATLLDLSPATARVRQQDGSEREVAPDAVPVGAVFIVHPGERIPLDGRVLSGESSVDQASITGESVPVPKRGGDEVFAGAINGEGALEVENLKIAQDTTLARVVRLVEEAQGRRAGVERWVDRFAAVYTPVVMALAAAVLLVPPLLLGGDWSGWVYRALVLLVIACPCALVISTPVTVVSALTSAARAGVLVRGGEVLEVAARVRVFALDKTGTLTSGEPRVERVLALEHGEVDLLARAAALEARSTHPIARAILEYATARGVVVTPAEDVRAIPGKGVTGTLDGRSYWLGSHRYLEELGGESAEVHARAAELADGGRSVVVVGSADHVCGLIAVADAVRPEAAEALAALRQAGVAPLVMLTGDNAETATRIAAALGIDEVRAELLPEDKLAAVDALVERHRTVAMVGDGVNDAPAMARASIGVAMGVAGSDVAIETGDVALMSDDLRKLAWLVAHSRRMLSVVWQNVAVALGVKALFTVLAFTGIATLWGAIAADMGASLLVVFNGLRMLGPRSGPPRANRWSSTHFSHRLRRPPTA
jgi:Cd2+/Zn2+-exporting ATPase